MIKVETCKGCGTWLLVDDFTGLRIKAEPTPLDAHAATQALVGGRQLWTAHTDTTGRPIRFRPADTATMAALLHSADRPTVLAEHRCTTRGTTSALPAPQTAAQEVVGTPAPKAPPRHPAAPSRPSSGRSTGERPVPGADSRTSNPTCSGCGQPCTDGTYAAVELGDVLVWAAHVRDCA